MIEILFSVRTRLTLWYAALFTIMVLVILVGAHSVVRATMDGVIQRRYTRSLDAIERIMITAPERLQWFDTHSIIWFFAVHKGQEFSYESEQWKQTELTVAPVTYTGLSKWSGNSASDSLLRVQTRRVETSGNPWIISVAQDIAPYETALKHLTSNILIACPFVLLLVMVSGHIMAGRVLSPIGLMASKAKHISADNLSERLPVSNPRDELGQLAAAFNDTLQQLEESFARLRRFTADASHELRTPLTVIRAVGEVGLAEPFQPDKCREAVASMLEESERLTHLVEGLLLLAKADANAIRLRLEPVSLASMCHDVAELLRVLAEEKDQQLLLDFSPTREVLADHNILRQALINILDNAIRYTPQESTITVEVGQQADGSPFVSVHDNGPGISQEDTERIFDRFYRAEESRHTVGCGLGLAIARWAVEANHGVIKAILRPEGGTTFHIQFKNLANVPS